MPHDTSAAALVLCAALVFTANGVRAQQFETWKDDGQGSIDDAESFVCAAP